MTRAVVPGASSDAASKLGTGGIICAIAGGTLLLCALLVSAITLAGSNQPCKATKVFTDDRAAFPISETETSGAVQTARGKAPSRQVVTTRVEGPVRRSTTTSEVCGPVGLTGAFPGVAMTAAVVLLAPLLLRLLPFGTTLNTPLGSVSRDHPPSLGPALEQVLTRAVQFAPVEPAGSDHSN